MQADMRATTDWIITPYVVVSAVAAVMAAVTLVVAWQRRLAPGGRPLVGLMIAVGLWSAGAALEYAAVAIPTKLFWLKVQYIGVLSCPVFFLLLALEYGNHDRWLTPRRIALLFLIPIVTLVLAVTNEWHGLIWASVRPVGLPADNLALYDHGLAFWLAVVGYSYLLMLVATILLIRAALRYPAMYQRQAALMILAALAPWLVNVLYISGFSPAPGLELTPLVMVFCGAIFAWSIFRYHLLELAPIARDRLIETMVDGMVVVDIRDRVVDINPAAKRLLGATTPVQIGQPARSLFAGWLDWEACVGDRHTVHMELSLHDAERHDLELNVVPIRDRQAQLSGRLVVLHDITALKAAQAVIERLNEELEDRVISRTRELIASEERFRRVITSISDHVFALQMHADGTAEMLFNSPRLSEITGVPTGEYRGDASLYVTGLVYPEDREVVYAMFGSLWTNDAAEQEYRVVCADGTTKWLRTSIRAHTQGNARVVYGVTSDITERKQVEQITVENRTMAAVDKLRTELIANVSHELRTPLGLIKAGSTTLLRSDVIFPPQVQHMILQGISDESDRLEHLVSNLLDMSRLDQGRFFLQYETVDLAQLLTKLIDTTRRKLASDTDTQFQFVTHFPPAPVEIDIDVPKIEQVVRNLFENAMRYSPAGGTITVDLNPTADGCEITVADQGIGIAPEEQGQIFERFYRSPDRQVQRIRGAGLGLSICREILRAHNGTINVTSTSGQGSAFVVWLPRTATPSAPVTLGKEAPVEHGARKNSGR